MCDAVITLNNGTLKRITFNANLQEIHNVYTRSTASITGPEKSAEVENTKEKFRYRKNERLK